MSRLQRLILWLLQRSRAGRQVLDQEYRNGLLDGYIERED